MTTFINSCLSISSVDRKIVISDFLEKKMKLKNSKIDK